MPILGFFPGGGKKQMLTEIVLGDCTWTVPNKVTSVNVRIFGGGGGGDNG